MFDISRTMYTVLICMVIFYSFSILWHFAMLYIRKLNQKEIEMETTRNELSHEDLNKITWDYSSFEYLGMYEGKKVFKYLFEVSAIGINSLHITRCNLAEGWLEYIEESSRGIPKRDAEDNVVKRVTHIPFAVQIVGRKGKKVILLPYFPSND